MTVNTKIIRIKKVNSEESEQLRILLLFVTSPLNFTIFNNYFAN